MFIQTGSFIIRGKRNFLQPQKIELGFTLMFCLTEESLANHVGERHLREDVQKLEEQKKEMDEEHQKMKSKQLGIEEDDDPDKIVVVQVGEKPKEWLPAEEKFGLN